MTLQTISGFYIGPVFIYFYGLVYAVFSLLLYISLLKKRDKIGVTEKQVDGLIIGILAGLIIGGRIFHFLINDPIVFVSRPIELFMIRNGGMSFFGSLIGILLSIGIWYWRNKKELNQVVASEKISDLKKQFSHATSKKALKSAKTNTSYYWIQNVAVVKVLAILDIGCLVASIGLIFGRLANFLNQELWGKLADPAVVWWCVEFATASGCRHPYQLYAAASHLLLALILVALLWRKARAGTIAIAFFIGYGILRFITDFWREDQVIASLGLTIWQIFALVLAIAGLVLLVKFNRHK